MQGLPHFTFCMKYGSGVGWDSRVLVAIIKCTCIKSGRPGCSGADEWITVQSGGVVCKTFTLILPIGLKLIL